MTDYQKEPVYVSYVLYMNPMMGRTEDVRSIKRFPSIEAARQFYDGEMVPSYQDEGRNAFGWGGSKTYCKSFKKGGPLEWYNPLYGKWWLGRDHYGQGLLKEFSEEHPERPNGHPSNYIDNDDDDDDNDDN